MTQQEAVGHYPARRRDGYVAGAQVDAVRACRQGDVEPVVDDQQGPVASRDGAQPPGLGEELPRRRLLVAQLYGRGAGRHDLPHYLFQRSPAMGARVGDHHQAERAPERVRCAGHPPPGPAPAASRRDRATARLCSLSVREKVCEPSALATKYR